MDNYLGGATDQNQQAIDKNLLEYFGLNSQKELMIFMRDNPDDKRVIELKELLNALK